MTSPAAVRMTEGGRPFPLAGQSSWLLLLAVFGIAPLVNALTTPRRFAIAPAPFIGIPDPALTDRATALLVTAQLAVVLGLIFLALPVVRLRANALLVSVAAVSAATLLTGLVHGWGLWSWPLVALLAFVCVILIPLPSSEELRDQGIRVLLAYGTLSLLAAAVASDWAVEREYDFSVLPGVTSRLHGVVGHANSLGPMMVVLLILEWRRPRRRPWVLAVGTVTLIATQSKTAWAALALIAGAAVLRHFGQGNRRPVAPILGVVAVMGVSVYLAAGVSGGAPIDRYDTSAETLTGRTAIWQATLEAWRTDRLLGYGPSLWDDAMAYHYRYRVGFAPGHAHNQLVQTLGLAGVVGAAALLNYVYRLASEARRAHEVSRGTTTALVGALVLRGITEVVMPESPVVADFFLHFLTFWYIAAASAEVADE